MNGPDEQRSLNSPEEWSADEQRLHDALHRAAEQVTPGPDALARIRRRTARGNPWWRNPVVIGLAAATAVAAALIVGGVIVFGGDDAPVASPGSPSATPEPSGRPSAPPTQTTDQTSEPTQPTVAPTNPDSTETAPATSITVPVYYVAGSDNGERLVREFHTVETTLPPVEAAIQQMLAQPASDPDYGSLWPTDVQVLSAEVADGVIGVDLSAEPGLADPSPERAEIATQQLVYTATAAASSLVDGVDGALPVQVTVAGQPVSELFGIGVAKPLERADPLDVRQLVQLNDPAEGVTVSSPVTIGGEAAAFEANVTWEVRQDGAVVASDFAMTQECCTFSPFSFEVGLNPGTYEIIVTEDDPSGGEGRAPFSDSKTFTVN